MYRAKRRNKTWKHCVGTGRLGLALQDEYIKHLRHIQNEIGFTYIRGHGLLHEDIGIYQEIDVDGVKEVFYNFTYVDRIFDTFIDLGLKPFVELGFMPKALASGEQTIFYWEGNVTPSKNDSQWCQLIKAIVEHFIERYGLNEVLTWPFEVWNEPNLTNFWKDADQAAYFNLYDLTARTIKSVHPDLIVGGPAICGGSDHWVDDFLTYCSENNVPVDFFSRHAYTSRSPHITAEYYYQELEPPEDMLKQFSSVKQQIENSNFPTIPLYITEFNTSYSPINPIHDTLLNAAYLAKILVEADETVDSLSYWTFSDVFEEVGIPKSQFHGGFGMMALNEIRKPTYHLYTFFNQLGEIELYRDDHIVITKKGDHTVVILAWNLVMEKGDGFTKQISYRLPLETEQPIFKQRKRLTEQQGNPWGVWKQLGRPRFPSENQVDILKASSKPSVETEQIQANSYDTITLEKNEVTLLTYFPIKDETQSYAGLDDSKLTSYSME